MKRKSKDVICCFLLAGFVNTWAASGIQVEVTRSTEPARTLCGYQVSNGGDEPVVSFAVGGNEELAGPYELTVAPEGLKAGVEAASPVLADGWQESLLSQPGDSTFAVEWETKDFAKAIMPRQTKRFELAFPKPDFSCQTGHWTAITRESQVISGMFKE